MGDVCCKAETWCSAGFGYRSTTLSHSRGIKHGILLDPSIWVGLLTLVVLEIVLGIDNLVFIAILADKLPPKQRDKARIIGLSLALLMRLALLSVISWMVTLTRPLFSVGDFVFLDEI